MSADATVIPFRPRPRRVRKLVSNGVMGMVLFIFVEVMVFAGFISAFVIVKSRAPGSVWPPPGQPRLPFQETALNTAALIASGLVLLWAHWAYQRGRKNIGLSLLLATGLGVGFVALQGVEWAALLRDGLTMTSSTYGSLFYTIIGTHAVHAIVAIFALAWAGVRLRLGKLTPEVLSVVSLFWYFVVLVWPFLYLQVYL